MVWRWPLKRSGLRLQGGVDCSHIERRSVVVALLLAVVGLLFGSSSGVSDDGVLGLRERESGLGEWVNLIEARPSHSILILGIGDFSLGDISNLWTFFWEDT